MFVSTAIATAAATALGPMVAGWFSMTPDQLADAIGYVVMAIITGGTTTILGIAIEDHGEKSARKVESKVIDSVSNRPGQ